jgi:hypothetical protein
MEWSMLITGNNEEHRNNILTFFLGGSIPTGVYRDRPGLSFGAGEPIAATHYRQYKDGLILTLRVPF